MEIVYQHGSSGKFGRGASRDEGVLPTRILDAVQGHAARTAGDGYGDVTVKAMAQGMEKIPRLIAES